jgi:cytokinesis protein
MGSNPGSARSSFLLGANLNGARKDMPITPNQKMKQLQWDKLPHQQVTNTLWQVEETTKEKEMIAKLSSDGIWLEMEADFQAKQLVINLLGVLPSLKVCQCISADCFSSPLARQKRAELKSVLDPQTKKRVGQSSFYIENFISV